MLKKMKSRGGLVAHLGVNDSREVEKMIENGDEHAKLIYDAMALNVARKIGEEAATVAGDVEAIILTGGIAYSEYFTSEVKKNCRVDCTGDRISGRERDGISGIWRTSCAAWTGRST